MNRRDFIKTLGVGGLVLAAPKVLLAKQTNIWDEDPQTVEELYKCINKYCVVLGHSNKAYEQFYMEGKYITAAHITYGLGCYPEMKDPEKRLVRSFWVTMRTKIVGNERDKPYIIWRRIPDFYTDPFTGNYKVTMRLSVLGDFNMDRYIKNEGERVTYLQTL